MSDDTCTQFHPTLGYPCERHADHPGRHRDRWENVWEDVDHGPVIHQPTPGYPGGIDVQHPSGECAWCDAQRWRDAHARTTTTDLPIR